MPLSTRILLVDDESFFRSVLAAYLKKLGFEVEESENAESACVKIHEFDPEIVLLDIVMPGKSGIEIVGTIKEWKPKCEIIMVAGAPSEDQKQECLSKGAFAVMSKPVELDEVKGIVLGAIEKIQMVP